MSTEQEGEEQVGPKSSRQWAWEFLRRNPAYREAYAQWLELPEVVRSLKLNTQELSRSLLEDIPMSYFVVEEHQQLDDKWHEKLSSKSKTEDFANLSPFHPKKGVEPLLGENLKEWHERTLDIRKEVGFTISHSSSILPRENFGLKKWVDPEVSPLPEPDANIFAELKFEVYAEFCKSENFRQKPCSVSVSEIKRTEVVLKIDVMQPIGYLKNEIEILIKEQRKFIEKIMKDKPQYFLKEVDDIYHVYEGQDKFNRGGIYGEYLKLLDRILKGESEDNIVHVEPGFARVPSSDNYAKKMRYRFDTAIELRDKGYRKIAYFDDYTGSIIDYEKNTQT
ncbi:transcriptional regulator domain-containing protein [Comamonas aquatica]|uniref:transcriptional regulator domain-containing protein n=1 Tax=Comamonas aquatica TaxID=225991 RepID=UPI001B388C9A|nr:DUF6499 domain-containing protein [Comamonas aquatica]QTX22453.1 hypothetical protein KAQ61_08610 [Comamonas aquatica]